MEERSEIVRQQAESCKEFELGTWMGRRQAFGAMAGRCSAADAECLRKIRQEKLFKAKGVEWPEFCRRYLGMSRANAERLIRILEKFGPNYFRLAEIVRLSPENYRLIAGAGRARPAGIHEGFPGVALGGGPGRGLAFEFRQGNEKWWKLVTIVLSAYWQALWSLPALLRKRRRVAKTAVISGWAFWRLLRRHSISARDLALQP